MPPPALTTFPCAKRFLDILGLEVSLAFEISAGFSSAQISMWAGEDM